MGDQMPLQARVPVMMALPSLDMGTEAIGRGVGSEQTRQACNVRTSAGLGAYLLLSRHLCFVWRQVATNRDKQRYRSSSRLTMHACHKNEYSSLERTAYWARQIPFHTALQSNIQTLVAEWPVVCTIIGACR